jgi:hypothetical protein
MVRGANEKAGLPGNQYYPKHWRKNMLLCAPKLKLVISDGSSLLPSISLVGALLVRRFSIPELNRFRSERTLSDFPKTFYLYQQRHRPIRLFCAVKSPIEKDFCFFVVNDKFTVFIKLREGIVANVS